MACFSYYILPAMLIFNKVYLDNGQHYFYDGSPGIPMPLVQTTLKGGETMRLHSGYLAASIAVILLTGCNSTTAPPPPTFLERVQISLPAEQLIDRGLQPDWSRCERRNLVFGPVIVAPIPDYGAAFFAASDTTATIAGVAFDLTLPDLKLESCDGRRGVNIDSQGKLLGRFDAKSSPDNNLDRFFDCVIHEFEVNPGWVNTVCTISILGCGATGNFFLCLPAVICAIDYLSECINLLLP